MILVNVVATQIVALRERKKHKTNYTISSIQNFLSHYVENYGHLPDSISNIAEGSLVFDGWGNKLVYAVMDKDLHSYKLLSLGPDKRLNTLDDFVVTNVVTLTNKSK